MSPYVRLAGRHIPEAWLWAAAGAVTTTLPPIFTAVVLVWLVVPSIVAAALAAAVLVAVTWAARRAPGPIAVRMWTAATRAAVIGLIFVVYVELITPALFGSASVALAIGLVAGLAFKILAAILAAGCFEFARRRFGGTHPPA